MWCFFADDDDLGHPGRSLEHAKAITSRPQQVAVAVVATTSRHCREAQKAWRLLYSRRGPAARQQVNVDVFVELAPSRSGCVLMSTEVTFGQPPLVEP